jgi:DUF971 family protein
MLSEKAIGIKADRPALQMTIAWADGHQSDYPFSLLRAACPCAQCRGGHENMKTEPDDEIFQFAFSDKPETRVTTVKPTGSYGITIVWEDGHDYGIFNWHYLRALCPCFDCRQQAAKNKKSPTSA